MAEQIVVITDNSADVPADLARAHGVFIVPQVVVVDDERLVEGEDVAREDVYRRLRERQPVRVGHPSPDDFRVLFRKMAKEVTGIVVVSPSTAFNPTLVSASVAAVTYGKLPAEAVNSHLVSAGVGLVALAAAERAGEAATLKEVAEAAREAIPRVHVAFLSGDLHYLRQAEHISALAYATHHPLGHRALFTVEKGYLKVVEYVPADKGIEALVGWLRTRVKGDVKRAIVVHADAAQVADTLHQAIEADLAPSETYLHTLAPMLAVRSGPGTVGVALMVGE